MALFYLSHRNIIKALLNAVDSGAEVKIILDPSKDAFGREKNGLDVRRTVSLINPWPMN